MTVRPLDVTVVIPARNRAAVLGRALQSVESQTSGPSDVIVIDDGSSDRTGVVARAFGARVIVAEGGGSGAARNLGILAAKTELIAFLDSDDEWLSHHLETVVGRMGDRVLSSSWARDSAGLIRRPEESSETTLTPSRCFLPSNPIVTSTVVARRQVLVDAGLFGTFARAQDVHMWARVLEIGSGRVIPEVTALYQWDDGTPRAALRLNDEWLLTVLDDLADRAWATPQLRAAVRAQVEWNEARRCYRGHEIGAAARQAARMSVRPRLWAPLAAIVLSRLKRPLTTIS